MNYTIADYKKEYNSWKMYPKLGAELKSELESLSEDEIEERFHKHLEFGTAGLRGLLGVGTNRMNIHTVSKVSEGLAHYIAKAEGGKDKGIVIGYDVRHYSKVFAETTAAIMAIYGIKTYLFKEVSPTPLVSYAIRELGAVAGVMITASHNPKEYNGYKVYCDKGTQITDKLAESIAFQIKNAPMFFDYVKLNKSNEVDLEDQLNDGIVQYVEEDLIESYLEKVSRVQFSEEVDKEIKVVYSPLNGTGNGFVDEVLKRNGFSNVHVVEEQRLPDPDFSTIGTPNPEETSAFYHSVALASKVRADILIATDPDADRVGVLVPNGKSYTKLTGNEIGTLLANYILERLDEKGELDQEACIMKSIVTDDLVTKIAEEYGVTVFDTHVGFKNIYSMINNWEPSGYVDDFIMGFEESLGFGIGSNIARDKDAISASLVIVEMAAYYKKRNKTLLSVYNEIQIEHGYHKNKVLSITMEGIEGKKQLDEVVDDFRNNTMESINGAELVESIDYMDGLSIIGKENVLSYEYHDGTWFVIRPSGTEPKLKVYVFAAGEYPDVVERTLERAVEEIMLKIKKITHPKETEGISFKEATVSTSIDKKLINKAYMAGKLFSEADGLQRTKEYRLLKEANKANGIAREIFSPLFAPINDKSTLPTALDIFNGDESELMTSDVIFADLADGDLGVMMELGMVLHKDVKVYAYLSDIRLATAGSYDGINVPFGYNQFVIGGLQKYFGKVYGSFDEALEAYIKDHSFLLM